MTKSEGREHESWIAIRSCGPCERQCLPSPAACFPPEGSLLIGAEHNVQIPDTPRRVSWIAEAVYLRQLS